MPLAKSLGKVTKLLQNRRGQIHPKGRKFKMLNRATNREKKLLERKARHAAGREHELLLMRFFQQAVAGERAEQEVFSVAEVRVFVEAFIARDDEEIEELVEARRPGRPASTRLQQLQQRRAHEEHVFDTGFEVPDLAVKENVERLRAWNGTSGGVGVINMVFVARE